MLSEEDRQSCYVNYIQKEFKALAPTTQLIKSEVRALINHADDWLETDKGRYNSSIPEPIRTKAVAAEKAFALGIIAEKRAIKNDNLNDSEKEASFKEFVENKFRDLAKTTLLIKSELRTLIDTANDWLETDKLRYNNTIPVDLRTKATPQEKLFALKIVAYKRALLEDHKMAALDYLHPLAATGPSDDFATIEEVSGVSTPPETFMCLAFSSTSSEHADFRRRLSEDYAGGGITVSIRYSCGTASGGIRLEVAIRRIEEDVDDVNSSSHTYSYQAASETTLPSAAGEFKRLDINLDSGTEMDNLVAGEEYVLRVRRDHDHADDTASADLYIQGISIKDQ